MTSSRRPTAKMNTLAAPLFACIVAIGCTSSTDGSGADGTDNSGAGNGNANVDPTISCEGNNNLAMMWAAVSQGTPLLPEQAPAIGGDWVQFLHPTTPLLGFRHPPDWTGTALAQGSDVGVNLVKGGREALYLYLQTLDVTGQANAGAWLDTSIREGFSALDDAGDRTQLCGFGPITMPVAFGSQTAIGAVVTTGDKVLLSSVVVSSFTATASNGISVQSFGANRSDFNQIADEVFFSIIFQLLIGEAAPDSDFDGTPDATDNFPLDPNRQ